MCRHLAYVGAPIRMGTLLTDPPFSLVRQSWAPRRQQHGVVNADGFGVGWYPIEPAPGAQPSGSESGRTEPSGSEPGWTEPGPTEPGRSEPGPTEPGRTEPGRTEPGRTQLSGSEPGRTEQGPTEQGPTEPGPTEPGRIEPARHRGAGPVWADETFAELSRVISTSALLAAVRSATVGMVGGQSVAAAAPFRRGSWLFSHNGALPGWPDTASRLGWGLDPGVLATLEAPTDSALLWAITVDLIGRGKTAAATLTEVIGRVQDAGGGRATMLLTDGQTITATAWGTSLCWRRLPGGVVVASEPYDDDAGWVDVPDQSLLFADRDAVTVEPLIPTGTGVPR